jgi:hypothetical protein
MKIIQKQIKKELSEEVVLTFDFSKSSLSAGEINELITTLSLNIIKTRETLKETFDGYIITLISFDKIKNKIKFLKTKNDESFNDCSPIFSNKFKLISNIGKNFNNNFEGNEDCSNLQISEPECYSSKISQISQKTQKRSKNISNAALQENYLPDNSAEGKSPDENANSVSYPRHNLDKDHKETFRDDKNEMVKSSKFQTKDKFEKKNIGNSFDKKREFDEDYDMSRKDDEFESFANNNYNRNKDFSLNNLKNTRNCVSIPNAYNPLENHGKNKASKCEDPYYSDNKEAEGDYYGVDGEDDEHGFYNNNYLNKENPYSYKSYADNENSFCNKNEINNGNMDINSLYLKSIQEEELQLYKSKYCSNPQNYHNKYANDTNKKYYTETSKNSEIKENLNKSEEEFKRNFPMKFYRHFQTENNCKKKDANMNSNTETNAPYKRARKPIGHNSYMNNNSQLGTENRFDESCALYNFDQNNFSAISNDLNLHSNRNRNKNKSCNFLNFENIKNLNPQGNENSAYLDNEYNIEKSLISNLDAGENFIKNHNQNKQIKNKFNKTSTINIKSNFISPYKQREVKTPILNTGNKIRKMKYFDNLTNHSLFTKQTNQNKELEKEESEKDENYSELTRKSELDNACIYSMESNSVYICPQNKNSLKNDNHKQNDNSKKGKRNSTFGRNTLEKSTGETFNGKSKQNLHVRNNSGLLDSKKTLPLDFSNNSNIQNLKNSRAFINESSFYTQNNNSNYHLNSSKAANPENSHIDVIKSSSDQINKAAIENNKNLLENTNHNSAILRRSQHIQDNSMYSKNSYALNEKTHYPNILDISNQDFNNPSFSNNAYKTHRDYVENNVKRSFYAQNDDAKKSFKKINNNIRHEESLRNDDRNLISTNNKMFMNRGRIEKNNQISFESNFSYEDIENVSPNL